MVATLPVEPSAEARPARPEVRRPSRLRYLLVALLAVVGLGVALLWYFQVDFAVGKVTKSFTRGSVPGEVAVMTHPDPWYVYAEGGATVQTIQVTDASGQLVPVKPSSAGSYDYGGQIAHAVGEFQVKPGQGGDYRVVVTGSSAFGSGSFAVGDFNVSAYQRPQSWGTLALLVVNLGSAIAIAVVPIIQRRRDAQLV